MSSGWVLVWACVVTAVWASSSQETVVGVGAAHCEHTESTLHCDYGGSNQTVKMVEQVESSVQNVVVSNAQTLQLSETVCVNIRVTNVDNVMVMTAGGTEGGEDDDPCQTGGYDLSVSNSTLNRLPGYVTWICLENSTVTSLNPSRKVTNLTVVSSRVKELNISDSLVEGSDVIFEATTIHTLQNLQVVRDSKVLLNSSSVDSITSSNLVIDGELVISKSTINTTSELNKNVTPEPTFAIKFLEVGSIGSIICFIFCIISFAINVGLLCFLCRLKKPSPTPVHSKALVADTQEEIIALIQDDNTNTEEEVMSLLPRSPHNHLSFFVKQFEELFQKLRKSLTEWTSKHDDGLSELQSRYENEEKEREQKAKARFMELENQKSQKLLQLEEQKVRLTRLMDITDEAEGERLIAECDRELIVYKYLINAHRVNHKTKICGLNSDLLQEVTGICKTALTDWSLACLSCAELSDQFPVLEKTGSLFRQHLLHQVTEASDKYDRHYNDLETAERRVLTAVTLDFQEKRETAKQKYETENSHFESSAKSDIETFSTNLSKELEDKIMSTCTIRKQCLRARYDMEVKILDLAQDETKFGQLEAKASLQEAHKTTMREVADKIAEVQQLYIELFGYVRYDDTSEPHLSEEKET